MVGLDGLLRARMLDGSALVACPLVAKASSVSGRDCRKNLAMDYEDVVGVIAEVDDQIAIFESHTRKLHLKCDAGPIVVSDAAQKSRC